MSEQYVLPVLTQFFPLFKTGQDMLLSSVGIGQDNIAKKDGSICFIFSGILVLGVDFVQAIVFQT